MPDETSRCAVSMIIAAPVPSSSNRSAIFRALADAMNAAIPSGEAGTTPVGGVNMSVQVSGWIRFQRPASIRYSGVRPGNRAMTSCD